MFFRAGALSPAGARLSPAIVETVARTARCASRSSPRSVAWKICRQSGQLERLLRSGARFADKAFIVVVGALSPTARATTSPAATDRGRPGVRALVGGDGLPRAVVEGLAGARKHDFPLERAVFLIVLHHLFSGGSDRAADRWRQDYRIEGVEGLDLHHLYRAMGWPRRRTRRTPAGGRNLPPLRRVAWKRSSSGGGAVRAAARPLPARSTWCSWTPPVSISRGCWVGRRSGRRGFSKDHRAGPQPNDPGGAARRRRPAGMHRNGGPENTADVGSLIPAVDRLRQGAFRSTGSASSPIAA